MHIFNPHVPRKPKTPVKVAPRTRAIPVDPCHVCNGEGMRVEVEAGNRHVFQDCSYCNGSGSRVGIVG